MQKDCGLFQAIRAKCMECSGEQTGEVRSCPVTDCPL